jgi:hypothetical protein
MVQTKGFVSKCSTYSLSLPSIYSDRDSCQVTKFVYMRSTCSVALLNNPLKLELPPPPETIRVYFFVLHLICDEYGLETFGDTSLMEIFLNTDVIDVSLET